MKLTALLLLTSLTTQAQFYAGLDGGMGVILHETNGTIAGHGGYTVQTPRINFYAEINALYGTRNRGQVSLSIGSTAFSQHIVLMGGLSTEQYKFMGKYQIETKGRVSPLGTLYYHWKAVDAGMYVVARCTPGTWSLGVGVGRNLIR